MRGRVEYKLIELGLRLRDVGRKSFTWRDLAVVVEQMADWDTGEQLLAHAASSLQWLVWSKTKDGQKNRKQPKPILPPQILARQEREKGIALPADQYRERLKGDWKAPTPQQRAAFARMMAGNQG